MLSGEHFLRGPAHISRLPLAGRRAEKLRMRHVLASWPEFVLGQNVRTTEIGACPGRQYVWEPWQADNILRCVAAARPPLWIGFEVARLNSWGRGAAPAGLGGLRWLLWLSGKHE